MKEKMVHKAWFPSKVPTQAEIGNVWERLYSRCERPRNEKAAKAKLQIDTNDNLNQTLKTSKKYNSRSYSVPEPIRDIRFARTQRYMRGG